MDEEYHSTTAECDDVTIPMMIDCCVLTVAERSRGKLMDLTVPFEAFIIDAI